MTSYVKKFVSIHVTYVILKLYIQGVIEK